MWKVKLGSKSHQFETGEKKAHNCKNKDKGIFHLGNNSEKRNRKCTVKKTDSDSSKKFSKVKASRSFILEAVKGSSLNIKGLKQYQQLDHS